jgi:hypothetical protein
MVFAVAMRCRIATHVRATPHASLRFEELRVSLPKTHLKIFSHGSAITGCQYNQNLLNLYITMYITKAPEKTAAF